MKKFFYRLAKKNTFLNALLNEVNRRRLEKNLHLSPTELETKFGSFKIHHHGTVDHISVIKSTLISESYDISFCIQGRKLSDDLESKLWEKNLILDLGSHIGVSMLYFAAKYPNCIVVGVEPNSFSVSLIFKNLAFLDSSKWFLYRACIGAKDKKGIPIFDNNNGSWAVSELNYTKQSTPLEIVDKVSIKSVLKSYQEFNKFILKIDIEGAEKELFDDKISWNELDSFQLIIIELHDWMLPSEFTSIPLFIWASNFKREIIIRGVNVFLFKSNKIEN
jgi:FkbM family methyltransferase